MGFIRTFSQSSKNTAKLYFFFSSDVFFYYFFSLLLLLLMGLNSSCFCFFNLIHTLLRWLDTTQTYTHRHKHTTTVAPLAGCEREKVFKHTFALEKTEIRTDCSTVRNWPFQKKTKLFLHKFSRTKTTRLRSPRKARNGVENLELEDEYGHSSAADFQLATHKTN